MAGDNPEESQSAHRQSDLEEFLAKEGTELSTDELTQKTSQRENEDSSFYTRRKEISPTKKVKNIDPFKEADLLNGNINIYKLCPDGTKTK